MLLHDQKMSILLIALAGFFILSGCTATETIVMEKKTDPCEQAMDHIQQGMAYSGQRDYQNSEKEFLLATNLCPTSAVAHANLGTTYIQMRSYNKAERSLETAVNLDTRDPNAMYNLAAVYSLSNKVDLSLEALDKCLNNGFNNIEALRTDPDLDNARKDPEYTKLLEKHRIFLK
jgi:Flp pilus assembly protein TadD